MADDTNTIQLNPSKPSVLEFDVTISGLENIAPLVRFVVIDVQEGVDWVVKCSKTEGTKWVASFPAFDGLKLNTCKFCVEVVVEEYYFKPAEGTITFINSPDVSFKPKAGKKPTVTTSFTVKQDDKLIEPKKKESKPVKEAMAITGQLAPNNSLLKREEDPAGGESHSRHWDANQNDEFIDKSRLDAITDEDPIPGEGNQYPQKDGKGDYFDSEYDFDDSEEEDEDENELVYTLKNDKLDFDPNKIAEDIIKNTIGNITPPTTKGSLFKRDADGKLMVPGFETKAQKQSNEEKNKKIRDLLK
jgi:hypothetical protein